MTLSQKTIEGWTDEALKCRTVQHQWEPYTAKKIKGGFEQLMACLRCEAEKTLRFDNKGYITGSHISYPDGYLAPKGTGQLDADDRARLRLAVINILGG